MKMSREIKKERIVIWPKETNKNIIIFYKDDFLSANFWRTMFLSLKKK